MKNSPTSDQINFLAAAVRQVLDDMGPDGQCCCKAAKDELRRAYEPFADREDSEEQEQLPTNETTEPISLLLNLRARVLQLANCVDGLADNRSIVTVRRHAPAIAERMRALVSETKYVKGCKRAKH